MDYNIFQINYFDKWDIYFLTILSQLKGRSISQEDVYFVALLDILRNILIYFLFVAIAYIGILRNKWSSFKNIYIYIIPLTMYWLKDYSTAYREFPIGNKYDVMCACSIFLLIIILFYKKIESNIRIPTEIPDLRKGCLLIFSVVIVYFFIMPHLVSSIISGGSEKSISIPYRYGFIYAIPIVIYSLVVACSEEVFYRGILFNTLYHETGKIRAYLIAGILFALFHFKDVRTTITTFIFALISSWLLVYTRSIYVSILVHFSTLVLYFSIYGFS